MDAYCSEVRKLEGKFFGLEFHHVLRDSNSVADALSKLGSSRATVPKGTFVQELHKPSIKTAEEEALGQTAPQPTPEVLSVSVPPEDWR